MERRCSTLDCNRTAVIFAESFNEKVYACSTHTSGFILTNRTFPLMVDISGLDKSKIIEDATKKNFEMNRIKKELVSQYTRVFNDMSRLLKNTLKKICKFQLELQEFCLKVRNGEPVNKRIFEEIKTLGIIGKIKLLQQLPKVQQAIDNCKHGELCEFLAGSQCKELIFAKKPSGRMYSIDLESFVLKEIDYEISFGYNNQLCKIDENLYLISAGFKSGFTKNAYLLNTLTKELIRYPDSVEKAQAASIYTNEKVYVFGGSFNKPSNTCYSFRLDYMQWEKIQNLPKATTATTAAVLENSIIVSGFDSDKVYSYNNVVFSPILDVPASVFKIVCEGWVLVNSKLFKNINGDIRTWKEYSVEWIGLPLLNYTTFKRKQYFYFLTESEKLCRINTRLKNVEIIHFH